LSANTKILLVDHGAAPITYSVIVCLIQLQKYELHILSFSSKGNPYYKYSKYIKGFTHYNTNDFDKTFDLIKATALELKVDVVVPLMERTIDIVSRRVNELKAIVHLPPIPMHETIDLVIDKWLLQNWLYANKYTDIKPVHLSDLFDNRIQEVNLKYPFLIKPFWGSDGKGIVKINNKKEYLQIFKQHLPDKDFLLVQPFIEGFDIDISFLAEEGKIIVYAIQQSLAKEKRFKYSRSIKFIKNDRLLEFTSNIVRDLNYSGVAHLDLRYDTANSRYELVDFNTRFWGSILGSLHVGINFPDLVCKKAMGQELDNLEYRADNYFETFNIFKVIINTILRRGRNHPTYFNTQLKYYLKDRRMFIYFLFDKFISKIKK
jgi:predicted ATP-grasp superfamily ATP-dependent carboligase